MSNTGCRIVKDFIRPDKELVEAFRNLSVANIDDCLNRTAAVDSEICPLNKNFLLGPAFTVKVPAGDNLMYHKALMLAKPGDVICIDAGGYKDRAIFGEIMTTFAQKAGIAGVIVDGAVRDSEELSKMNIPVYARAVTPNGPYKNGAGEINTEISFGGKVIRPGDIIVGGADGIIIIKPEDAEDLIKKVKAVIEKEAKSHEKIENGEYNNKPWVDQKLKELGCEII